MISFIETTLLARRYEDFIISRNSEILAIRLISDYMSHPPTCQHYTGPEDKRKTAGDF